MKTKRENQSTTNTCSACNESATRLLVKSIDYTDAQYDTIKKTLLEVANYNILQAKGTIMSIRMQRSLVNSKIVTSVSDSIIYNGNEKTAELIQDTLLKQGIESYIASPNKYMK